MTLSAGTKLGPYSIVAPIGAGGMGEVYRALDTRLGREVAVKVLSRNLSRDDEALQRFEQEARAAGMLNHPNILAIFDIGSEGDQRYIVSELLEGESVRARIRQGPIPARKAADYGVQIARGLAAAHEKGIVHRDLKPENLFITRDGQVKILDFGLVKLMQDRTGGVAVPAGDESPTVPWTPTEPGRILGTIGYMAPEQVRGSSGDQRSDIFSFGTILYEMVTGRVAFRGESPVETLNAILKEDPPDLFELGIKAPPALDRLIRHCLEKNPGERFQSARDVAFALGAMSGLTSQMSAIYPLRRRLRPRALVKPLLIALAAAAILAGGYAVGKRRGTQPPPSFERVTYRSGTIRSARFSPDGQTVIYAARFAGKPVTVFTARTDSPESRDLGLGLADLLAVSSTGQLAISLRRHPIGYLRDSGTLAQVGIAGGAPREIQDDVEAADWTPDGKGLAIVRTVEGHCRLEYPIGSEIARSAGWISHPRFSPDGKRIAFVDHPFVNDDRGTVVVVDPGDKSKKTLTREYQSIEGLAWSAHGDEVWFGAELGRPDGRAIVAATLEGKARVVVSSAGSLWLHDIAPDGRLLVTQQTSRGGISAIVDGEAKERDLSWLDYSVVRDLSDDGSTLLFSESGEAGGSIYGIYIRKVDGSPAVRLGEGTSEALSPDGKWVLSIPRDEKPAQIVMLPVGPGQLREVTNDRINHRNARFSPDGGSVLFQGNEPGAAPRLWVQPIGGAPRAITPENVSGTLFTPDGKFVLGRSRSRKFNLYPVAGGTPQPVPALEPDDVSIQFSRDGRSVFVSTFGKVPAVLTRVDLVTGERTKWREVMPPDVSGLINVGPVWPTPDGRTIVYSHARLLSDLYIVRGVR